jgi:hypothetical protein
MSATLAGPAPRRKRPIKFAREASPRIAKIRAEAVFASGTVTAEDLVEYPWLHNAVADWGYDPFVRVWRKASAEERQLATILAHGHGHRAACWGAFVRLARDVLAYQPPPSDCAAL